MEKRVARDINTMGVMLVNLRIFWRFEITGNRITFNICTRKRNVKLYLAFYVESFFGVIIYRQVVNYILKLADELELYRWR